MSFLSIEHLTKSYGTHQVVQRFDLDVQPGEFVSFLGPSGCGKTTTLRMIAGFETATSGAIRIEGRDVTHLPPNARNVGMVFQNYALFPNMTVAGNVAFGLKVAKASGEATRARVAEMLGIVKLDHLADRYPYQISGGQQQRVALARALATSPKLLLLDEPLSALDAKVRLALRDELKALQRTLGITTVFVTHDQEEALSMSDRIVVMSEGRIEQLGTPFEIYNRPKTRFVASFIGTLNILNVEVVDAQSGAIRIDGQEARVGRQIMAAAGSAGCAVALRPEAVTLHDPGNGGNRIRGTIADVAFLGAVVRVKVEIGGSRILLDRFNSPGLPPPLPGESVTLHFSPDDLVPLEAA
ncbi:ABC transporter ATP-binding protein [Lichenibacterium ramalinae]|uniref:Spermidine/putrescine import ATP-binding protein PotA n=1 Tax=Lichenibacterium ramalinae TaxID=2316527 RepID=A0A4Q2REI5_9HYPH|nr:ABC transporter ATP-binding protein [Lichenibacterium ramalinae]RYB05603.1 ABC transporter ATP-binding protein [Lichenibacterium ramalinae]